MSLEVVTGFEIVFRLDSVAGVMSRCDSLIGFCRNPDRIESRHDLTRRWRPEESSENDPKVPELDDVDLRRPGIGGIDVLSDGGEHGIRASRAFDQTDHRREGRVQVLRDVVELVSWCQLDFYGDRILALRAEHYIDTSPTG